MLLWKSHLEQTHHIIYIYIYVFIFHSNKNVGKWQRQLQDKCRGGSEQQITQQCQVWFIPSFSFYSIYNSTNKILLLSLPRLQTLSYEGECELSGIKFGKARGPQFAHHLCYLLCFFFRLTTALIFFNYWLKPPSPPQTKTRHLYIKLLFLLLPTNNSTTI